ncbi:MAG: hypothetical protein KME26_17180 [Oscillatoria princeps RMCB-10]|jgi:hypothetical protein|nr:hypothetical protein [Oscillatoria princeps RMCB-10]
MTVKPNLSLAAIVSATAITGGVLLAAANPTQAFGCPFSKSGGTSAAVTRSNLSSLSPKKQEPNKFGIAAASIASLAGLFAAGMAYKARRTGKLQPETGDVAPEDSLQDSSSLAIPQEAFSSPSSEEASPSRDRELTLVS